MKRRLLLLALICTVTATVAAQESLYQHGMVIRMRMADCLSSQRGVMAALAGNAAALSTEQCPEYTLVTETIVYVIAGKSSGQIIPLAERTDFRFKHNELLIRVDDERRETHFVVKEMALRLQWEHNQQCASEVEPPPVRSSLQAPVVHSWH